MRSALAPFLLALLLAPACSTTPAQEARDPERRAELIGLLRSLEGHWEARVEGLPASTHVFAVSSGGSAVREIMGPGSEHEMTNMYTLEGNGVVLTHYCAAGNQPRMRAEGVENGRLEFRTVDVADLATPDALYMGELTLVLIDENNLEQRWRAIEKGKVAHEMVIRLGRLH